MPTAPGTRCADPLCGRPATAHGRCAAHQRPAWQQRSARNAEMTRAESQSWHDRVFAAHGDTCQACGAPGTDADHIIPVSEGGAPHDIANSAVLCRACHARKTAEETARANRRRRR